MMAEAFHKTLHAGRLHEVEQRHAFDVYERFLSRLKAYLAQAVLGNSVGIIEINQVRKRLFVVEHAVTANCIDDV